MKKLLLILLPVTLFLVSCGGGEGNLQPIEPINTTYINHPDSILTYIPDTKFEENLINLGLDDIFDDFVLTENIKYLEEIDLNGLGGIQDLTGIENFVALKKLHCQYNQLTSLDLSYNTSLTFLNCYGNQITSLDLSNNTDLALLNCNNNLLTSLDLSNNSELFYLACIGNKLTSLDVSNNTALTFLTCRFTELTSLDVSNNTALTELQCGMNQITSLDVSNNTALTRLGCEANQITSLDVSNNTALTRVNCQYNQLTNLNLRNGNNTNMSPSATSNNQLYCIEVDNAAWSTSNWTDIDLQHYFSEDCS
ncbi:leucine-rich repeat domain-containing protein [Flavobacteriales bacterium]|nr:leucine-rich repeat domain-containing protein [Flavobacteriales bacterium]